MKIDLEIAIQKPIGDVFSLLHDYEKRLLWDPFLSEARVLSGVVGVGCRVLCRDKKLGLAMETEYVSFKPPKLAAVRMTKGPFFLKSFTGTWLLKEIGPHATQLHFHYNVEARPRFLSALMSRLFQRESKTRLEQLKAYLER